MAFNGSGTHVRVYNWVQDLANTIPVTASRVDGEADDFSTALTNTICRDGQSTTTARIPFAAGTSSFAGSTSSVAYGQTGDNNTGVYFPATDQWGIAAGGTGTLTSTSAKVTVAVAMDCSGVVAPTSSDGAALGSTTQMWSDLFLASGAVINFNNGDVTLTHSANTLAFAGASSGYSFDAAVTVSSGGAAITGNSTVTGTLGVSSDFAVNTNKFTVTASSGNTAVAGTLAVTGAVTLTSSVSAASIAGSMVATQAQMETASATDLVVTPGRQHHHPGMAKAWGIINSSATVQSSYGISSATKGGTGNFTFNFSTSFSATDSYVVFATAQIAAGGDLYCCVLTKTTSSCQVTVSDAAGIRVDPNRLMIVAFGDFA